MVVIPHPVDLVVGPLPRMNSSKHFKNISESLKLENSSGKIPGSCSKLFLICPELSGGGGVPAFPRERGYHHAKTTDLPPIKNQIANTCGGTPSPAYTIQNGRLMKTTGTIQMSHQGQTVPLFLLLPSCPVTPV